MADDVNMSSVEDETINHVLPELVASLDLAVIFDKLLRENLISSETHEHLATLLVNGLTGDAVRETMMKIKRNSPGYLTKFIKVLQSEDRSKHFADRIEQGIIVLRGV